MTYTIEYESYRNQVDNYLMDYRERNGVMMVRLRETFGFENIKIVLKSWEQPTTLGEHRIEQLIFEDKNHFLAWLLKWS